MTDLSDSQALGNSTLGSGGRVISPHTVICTEREHYDPRQEIIRRLEQASPYKRVPRISSGERHQFYKDSLQSENKEKHMPEISPINSNFKGNQTKDFDKSLDEQYLFSSQA